MWFYRRTGPMWGEFFACFVLAGLLRRFWGFWPLVVLGFVLYWGFVALHRYSNIRSLKRDTPELATADDQAKIVGLQHEWIRLSALERLEQGTPRPLFAEKQPLDLEEMNRLQQKWYGRPNLPRD